MDIRGAAEMGPLAEMEVLDRAAAAAAARMASQRRTRGAMAAVSEYLGKDQVALGGPQETQ